MCTNFCLLTQFLRRSGTKTRKIYLNNKVENSRSEFRGSRFIRSLAPNSSRPKLILPHSLRHAVYLLARRYIIRCSRIPPAAFLLVGVTKTETALAADQLKALIHKMRLFAGLRRHVCVVSIFIGFHRETMRARSGQGDCLKAAPHAALCSSPTHGAHSKTSMKTFCRVPPPSKFSSLASAKEIRANLFQTNHLFVFCSSYMHFICIYGFLLRAGYIHIHAA